MANAQVELQGINKMRARSARYHSALSAPTHVTFGSKTEMARSAPRDEFVVLDVRHIVRRTAELKRVRQRAVRRRDDRRDE